ncbi:hypothetical protein ACFSSA_13995 [Luteolibacter algae]|uniref:Cytochrome c-type biogenesis protein CcmF C-terminal domain-containing protein n=1 Tax=Luteolibacter algae TaxID=454151 RepID=A0ABW5DCY0_9BACT
MQLTKFDRWLKEKFVYEIQILTLRPLDNVPKHIRHIELPEKPGRRYKHLYTTGRAKAANEMLAGLKENNQMFTTKVVDKKAWWVEFVAPKGKSVTWYLVSVFLMMGGLAPVIIWIRGLLQNPEFMKNMKESLEILRG